jgi:DNA (cytosine-5)-methyltransferase 1
MSEIATIPPNGFKAISLFAGGGGSSLGYRMAGFSVLWASEFIEAARDTYRANQAPGTIIDERDIREVRPFEVLKAIGLGPGDLDVLDGSPPCSSFSMSGRREEQWDKAKNYSGKVQRTDDLFSDYIRFVREIQPKVFVAENVAGLARGVAKGYLLEIMRGLRECGYRVEARLLDAQWLGVPQQRERVIFVGVRNDLGLPPAFPEPLPYRYGLREAFEGLLLATIEPETDISRYAIGKEYDRLVPGRWSERYQNLGKVGWDSPSFAVTVQAGNPNAAGVVHPDQKRKYSIAELKRVCGFPDDVILTGNYRQQWERLGRAVPPPMMKAVAEAVRDRILVPSSTKTAALPQRSKARSRTDRR